MERLGEYLDRVMRQKRLTPKEVARRCGLTDSYIGRLRKCASANLTVDTMRRLAAALDVNAHDIFTAASGHGVSEARPLDPLLLLEAMQKLVADPNGFESLRRLFSSPPGDRKTLVAYVDYFKRPPARHKGKTRRKSKARRSA